MTTVYNYTYAPSKTINVIKTDIGFFYSIHEGPLTVAAGKFQGSWSFEKLEEVAKVQWG